ncbi:MAG: peptidyl-alpha-hydroxyglycine alpha-amidating lyase family protein [Chitinophagaceae bacterium]
MNNYTLASNWPDFADSFQLGTPTGIGIDSNQNIFIFHRAGRKWPLDGSMYKTRIAAKTILLLDSDNGKIINSWGDNLFIMPHGLTVDPNNNIWVTDVGLHQVFKFNSDGELLMTLGKAIIPGNDSTHFNLPTDVAVTKAGSFYVSDGYGNSRVVKFSATGQYLFEWGVKGDKKGEFNLPHAIELDNMENVYIADRENNRIQAFTSTGKFIKQWTNESFGKISSVVFERKHRNFLAVDYFISSLDTVFSSAIILFNKEGDFLTRFGEKDGVKCWYHNIAVDNQGNIYITDILGDKIKKFIKLPVD